MATHDVSLIVGTVLSLGDFHDKPNQKLLYSDIGDWLAKYGSANFGGLNMGLNAGSDRHYERKQGIDASQSDDAGTWSDNY